MSELLFTLGRVYGIDSIIEFLIIIVCLMISIFSYKIYKILKIKNFEYFSLGFIFLAISFIFKILSNLTISHRIAILDFNRILVITSQLEYMKLIQFISFLSYKSFHILGLLFLFFITTKIKDRNEKLMFLYFGILVIIFSIPFNFIFNLTVMFLLAFVTLHFYNNYYENRLSNSLLVFIAFALLTISHLLLMFSNYSPLSYLFGEIITLAGFLVLLVNQITLKNEKKTK